MPSHCFVCGRELSDDDCTQHLRVQDVDFVCCLGCKVPHAARHQIRCLRVTFPGAAQDLVTCSADSAIETLREMLPEVLNSGGRVMITAEMVSLLDYELLTEHGGW